MESIAKSGRSRGCDARGKRADTYKVNDVDQLLPGGGLHPAPQRLEQLGDGPRVERPATDACRRRRILAPNGLSHHERDLLSEGFDHMRRQGPCVFVSIEAGRSPEAEKIVRSLARQAKSHIALRQRRSGMRRVHSVSVFEALGHDGSPKFGVHIVALMPNVTARDKLIASLNGSKAYGEHVLAKPVVDWPGLTGYLLKEATPQAWYGKSFRRIKGSIPLGELGGDRVALSNDLRDTLLRSGRIKPYRRTYAKRQKKVVTQPVEPVSLQLSRAA